MLLNKLFILDEFESNETLTKANLHIDTTHPILKGHFPEQAVVPGVCMLELVKELIQHGLQYSIQLESASVIKFLTMFAPPNFTNAACIIQTTLFEENKIIAEAHLFHEQHSFLKFKGIFIRTI